MFVPFARCCKHGIFPERRIWALGCPPQAQPLAQLADLQRSVSVTASERTVGFHPLIPKNLGCECKGRLCFLQWIGPKGVVLSHSAWRDKSSGFSPFCCPATKTTLFHFGGQMDLTTFKDFPSLSDSIKFISTCTMKSSGVQFQFPFKGPVSRSGLHPSP